MKSGSIFFTFLLMMVFASSSVAQIEWEKYKENPVFLPGSAGDWDANLAPGCVMFDGTTYHQWYGGTDNGSTIRIGHATSPDGTFWTKDTLNNPVMDVGDAGTWEDSRLSDPYVLYINDVYHMWYGGHDGSNFCIGYATSPDGVDWTRYENNPVMTKGPSGSWMETHVLSPCVYFDGSTYHMWFTGENRYFVQNIGYATSPDGMNWTPYAENPVLEHSRPVAWDQQVVQAPTVVFDGHTFHMWFNGVNNANWWQWQIGYAFSPDGTSWTKYAGNPDLKPSPLGWDSQYVGYCSVELDSVEKQFHMWYGGGNGAWTGKGGYATAPWAILHVPGQFSTIQEGIDAADNGDVVLVADGTYYENINFKGKAITVASHFWFDADTSHISKTIIDGSQPSNPDSNSVVSFISGEDTTSVLCGFTITGGTGTYNPQFDLYGAGGIDMEGGKIVHNKIMNNNLSSAQKGCIGAGLGGDFQNASCNAIIENNEFINNSISAFPFAGGGALFCKWTSDSGYIRIANNLIKGNSVTCLSSYKAYGGGIGLAFDLPTAVDAVVENNIIVNNELHCKACMGAGIYVVYWEPGGIFSDDYPCPVISNNRIADNYSQDKGAGIAIWTVEKNHHTSSVIVPQPAIINNTIVNNKANDGCGIFNFDSYPLVLNNVLWDDLSAEGSREIFNDNIDYPEYNDKLNGGEVSVYYSDIQGGWEGEGNIDADPVLIIDNPKYEDYFPHHSSPCIDTGAESIQVNEETYDAPSRDCLGTSRPFGSGVDMGAVEWDGNNIPIHRGENPGGYHLNQNYPNPFNPSTTIGFTLPASASVELKIYNVLGKEVAMLVFGKLNPGNHTCTFDGSNLASGIYFYSIEAGDPPAISRQAAAGGSGHHFHHVRKMVLLK